MDLTLKELLIKAAELVRKREIINHGSIRCLATVKAMHAISCTKGIDLDEIGTDYIGDDDLAEKLNQLSRHPDWFMDVNVDIIEALRDLAQRFRGDDIDYYLDNNMKNELRALEDLISEAQNLVEHFTH